MCAAMEAVEKPLEPADDDFAAKADIVTIWSEAAILFKDNGERNDFAPGAAARCMPGLREQRKNREFCDIAFRTLDGSEIWAHRFVMAARYSGCHALFALAKQGMSTEEKWLPPMRLVVEDLGSDSVQLLVDVAYHIPLDDLIDPHNVADVLDLAEKLELSQLRNYCVGVFEHDLKPETCIGTYHLASSRGYSSLAREAFHYLVGNFDQQKPPFAEISGKSASAALHSVRLLRGVPGNSGNRPWDVHCGYNVRSRAGFRSALSVEEKHPVSEPLHRRRCAPSSKTTDCTHLNEVEDTFNALLKWIHADVDARKGYLAKFLPLLRLAWCSVQDFEKVITNPDVQGDGDCLKVLSVIHMSTTRRSMAVGQVAGMDLSHRTWLTPRIPKDVIVVFGGWTGDAYSNMLTYNCRKQEWRDIGSQNTLRRAYHGMALIDQCIYVVGGFDGFTSLDTVVCFDLARGRWSSKANMGRARCYVSVAVLKGYIYAMGGYDDIERSKTVECYCVQNNQWTNIADMNYIRSDASAAAACGRIYIAGGFSGHEYLDSVEYYDPSANVWTVVKPMPWWSVGHKLVAHNDTIYIIGGFSGHTRVASVAQYDVRSDKYSMLPRMPYAKSHFAAVVLEGSIYAIGGFDALSRKPTNNGIRQT
ncbi:hypothetical protein MTO96_021956 [Rhipicephalus appendiculatus]